jgi:hypothetical protein
VRNHGVVHGRLDSLGGRVRVDDGASAAAVPLAIGARPDQHEFHEEDGGIVRTLLGCSLLFLASILFLGVAPERFGRVQRALVERPVRTIATGMLGVIAAGVLMIALVVSLIGIPVAVVLFIASPIVCVAALASVVPVVGAMLPMRQLEGRPVARLAAGAFVVFIVTLVPVLGKLALALALLAGLGALVLTRAGAREADASGI